MTTVSFVTCEMDKSKYDRTIRHKSSNRCKSNVLDVDLSIIKNSSSRSEISSFEDNDASSSKEYLEFCDPDFQWLDYRSTLNKIYFGTKGKIKK